MFFKRVQQPGKLTILNNRKPATLKLVLWKKHPHNKKWLNKFIHLIHYLHVFFPVTGFSREFLIYCSPGVQL